MSDCIRMSSFVLGQTDRYVFLAIRNGPPLGKVQSQSAFGCLPSVIRKCISSGGDVFNLIFEEADRKSLPLGIIND